jgi:hypothetical protein
MSWTNLPLQKILPSITRIRKEKMFGIIDLKRILPWLLKSNKNLILIKFQDRGKQQVHRQLIGTGYLSARRWKLNSRTEQKEAMCTDTT